MSPRRTFCNHIKLTLMCLNFPHPYFGKMPLATRTRVHVHAQVNARATRQRMGSQRARRPLFTMPSYSTSPDDNAMTDCVCPRLNGVIPELEYSTASRFPGTKRTCMVNVHLRTDALNSTLTLVAYGTSHQIPAQSFECPHVRCLG